MTTDPERDDEDSKSGGQDIASGVGLAVALAALAAVGAGIAIQQLMARRLSKPEMARLRFYRYLREHGHLES